MSLAGLGPTMRGFLGPCQYSAVPDGGWGWAVAGAFFVVEVFTYGTIKSLGVFLQDLMEEFEETNSRVSWVISICVFVLTFSAPLSTVLSHRFGYRPVVMVGGALISLGTVCSAFTSSINQMYGTIGVVSGLGYCLAFLPTVTLLSQYFSRRRSLVTSMASSGECFAMFAFAQAFTVLKGEIGWRYCLVLIGVLQTSVIGCGVLLRPLVIKPDAEGAATEEDGESETERRPPPAYAAENEETQSSVDSKDSEDSGVTSLSASPSEQRAAAAAAATTETEALMEPEEKPQEGGDSGPRSSSLTPQERPDAGAEQTSGAEPSKLLDFSVLRDGAFVCYSLFGLFATLGFFAPQLYVIELGKSRGLDAARAASMLSVMAVAEACGRLSIGVVMSRAPVRKTRVLLGCVVLLAAVLAAFALARDFWSLAACCVLYGYLMGTVGSTHIPMLAEDDVVGVRRMPSAAGVYVFVQSFAGLAGPPLGGALVDETQNYGHAFYLCAAGMGLGAVFLALVGPARSRREDRKKGCEEEEKISQDSGPADYVEVDLDTSPARRSAAGGGCAREAV